ncbi:hypothetical protein ACEPAI_4106 [Sanghuangporus weigelae]
MTCGKPLSNDARQIIQNLFEAKEFSVNHLSALTGINHRTIFYINQQGQETVSVKRDSLQTGRPRILEYPDVHYLLSAVDFCRDLFLDELKNILGGASGKFVSDSMVWQTLERMGFTMKKITKKARERSETKQFFARGKTYSVLPAISLDGMLECIIVEGSFNADSFAAFIDTLLDSMQPGW